MGNESKNRYAPDVVFPPGYTLAEILEETGMSQADLAERMNVTPKHVNGMIKGKAPVTEETALRLERVLGVPASFWQNLELQYRSYLARRQERERLSEKKEWLARFPVAEMIRRKWIRKCNDEIDQLAEMLNFFRVATWDSWQDVWNGEGAAYRKSSVFRTNPNAMAAWLRKGEIEAEALECAPYDEKAFRKILQEIRELTRERPGVFLTEVPARCAACGVAVVFLKELSKTRVSGAARWLKKDRALIQISDRYKSDGQFWFSFFHEAGHILLHGKREVFIEDEEEKGDDPKEREADAFSRDILIPPKRYRELTRRKITLSAVESFAEEIGVSPGIVVGRLQHDRLLRFSVGNKLKQRIVL